MARQVGRKQRERGEVRLDTPALPLPLIHSFIDSFTLTLTLTHSHTHSFILCPSIALSTRDAGRKTVLCLEYS